MDPITTGVVVLIVAAVTILLATAVATGKMEIRPIRPTVLGVGGMLLIALYIALQHDVSLVSVSQEVESLINFVVDASVLMVVFTGFVTTMTKLSDDGGPSDVVAVSHEYIDLQKQSLPYMRGTGCAGCADGADGCIARDIINGDDNSKLINA